MSESLCAALMYYISVVASVIAALHAGHMKAAFYSPTNQVVDTTADLMQLLQITAKSPSVNCPPEKCFANCNQVKILHTDSRLLVQFLPWERTCFGHSLGHFIHSNLTHTHK